VVGMLVFVGHGAVVASSLCDGWIVSDCRAD